MAETGTATVGLLVGALGVAVALVGVAETADGDLSMSYSSVLLASAMVVTLAFVVRRHGIGNRVTASGIAAVAGVILALSGVVVLIDGNGWIGGVAVVSGTVGATLGLADATGIPAARLGRVSRMLSVSVLLVAGGFLLAGVLVSLPELIGGELSPVAASAAEQIALGMGFVGVALGFMLASRRGVTYLDGRLPGRRDVGWVIGGTVAVIATAIGLGLLFSALGVDGAEHEMARRAREDGTIILFVGMPLTLLATAVGEEVLYRNGIQKYLAEEVTPAAAILIASGLFTLPHASALVAGELLALLSSLATVFVLSVIIGIAYERTRSVVVAVAIHGTYNVAVFFLWYLELAV